MSDLAKNLFDALGNIGVLLSEQKKEAERIAFFSGIILAENKDLKRQLSKAAEDLEKATQTISKLQQSCINKSKHVSHLQKMIDKLYE